MKITQLITISLIFISATHFITAQAKDTTPTAYNFPGGIVDIRLDKQTDIVPDIRFGIEEPVIIEQSDHWRILIGIPLNTLPGEYIVYIKRAIKEVPAEYEKFVIQQKNYDLSETADTKNVIYLTHKKLSELEFKNTQQPSLPLQKPVDGDWSQTFGYLNLYAKKKDLIQQNVIYLDTTETLDISAPQNAIISNITTDENGNSSIYMDHGRGLYSIITGLNETTIEIGNGVIAGAVIGRVLQKSDTKKDVTRRITWQCIINGAIINPIILTQL